MQQTEQVFSHLFFQMRFHFCQLKSYIQLATYCSLLHHLVFRSHLSMTPTLHTWTAHLANFPTEHNHIQIPLHALELKMIAHIANQHFPQTLRIYLQYFLHHQSNFPLLNYTRQILNGIVPLARKKKMK